MSFYLSVNVSSGEKQFFTSAWGVPQKRTNDTFAKYTLQIWKSLRIDAAFIVDTNFNFILHRRRIFIKRGYWEQKIAGRRY